MARVASLVTREPAVTAPWGATPRAGLCRSRPVATTVTGRLRINLSGVEGWPALLPACTTWVHRGSMGNEGPDDLQMTVWRAEGVLMQRLGIDGPDARDLLAQVADNRGRTVGDMATEVLELRGLP